MVLTGVLVIVMDMVKVAWNAIGVWTEFLCVIMTIVLFDDCFLLFFLLYALTLILGTNL